MSTRPTNPPVCRGEGRPVRRRTRTFRPNYLAFSGTYQCNLTCPHCSVPIEWPDRLEIGIALRFLEQASEAGIEILGFTGGEPFLYPEFVIALTRRAAQLGMRFDKVQTNGVWFRDEAHLRGVLRELHEAGFTGKLGLSVDKFHGRHTEKAATFCRVAREIFQRDTIVSLSYASRAVDQGLEPVRDLAGLLDGVVEWSDLLHRYLLVTPEMSLVVNWNHLAPVERAENLRGAWDGVWFEEDYCEGPGQALIVTPRGDVKPCCGFASDLDQLTIGNIYRDSVETIIQAGRKHPFVGTIFRKGLTAIREQVEALHPGNLPGATSNHCFFCWYVLTRNLTGLDDAPPTDRRPGRRGLPMISDPASPPLEKGETLTRVLVFFDGRKVQLAPEPWEVVRAWEGKPYLVSIAGPSQVVLSQAEMTWPDYQAWIDDLRGRGFRFTTRDFRPCRE